MFLKGHGYIESLGIGLTAEGKGTISISVKGCGVLEVYANNGSVKGTEFSPPPSGNVYWGINGRGESSVSWNEN